MTENANAPTPYVHQGIRHQHGDDKPHAHPNGDENHKHGRSAYSQPGTEK